jgi:hypothetical protein
MSRQVFISFKNGYLFNNESEKLEYFQFEKAEFSFHNGEVKYFGKLAGVDVVLDDVLLYESEERFKQGQDFTQKETISEGEYQMRKMAWVFRNGKAIPTPHDEKYVATKRYMVELANGERAYESSEEAYDFNDIVVKEADGTERVVECAASKCKLTESQELLLARLTNLIECMEKENLGFIYDERDGQVKVINKTRIERIDTDCERYDACEGWADIQNMYVPTAIHCSYTHDDYFVNAKFND